MVTYHVGLRRKVLVMSCVLAHFGDSPMHAEISNTMNPSSSLSPCRVCDLSVKLKVDKQTPSYIAQFIGVSLAGDLVGAVNKSSIFLASIHSGRRKFLADVENAGTTS